MEILIHAGGLFLTFFVLQHYMMLGTHSRAHRLLPLVLGLIALYDFYEIVQCITKQTRTFTLLEDLLIIQFLYVMLHYFIEFMRMRWPVWIDTVMFVSLLTTNACIIYRAYLGRPYRSVYYAAAVFYSLVLLVVVCIVVVKYSYSKRQHFVSGMLYLAALLPWTALLARHVGSVPPQIVMTLALAASCVIIFYLLITDRFEDSSLYMQENIYRSSDNALILLDTDCYFLDANQEARRLLSDVLAAVEREQERSVYIAAIREYLAGKREALLWQREGEYYRGHITPVIHRGRLKGYVLTMFDITPQMKEIRESERKMEEAQDLTVQKSRFMARMSHDLRSPLHAIIGISDVLIARQDLLSEERGLLRQLRQAGMTLLKMVDDILDFSKLEAGRMELKPAAYDLRELLEEVAADHAVQLLDRPVELTLSVRTPYPLYVTGDADRVREILQNLLSNAVKFTKEGSVACEVFCEEVLGEGRVRLICHVRDTGPGMKEEQLRQIFREYVSFADSRTLEGSGLGLCIVQQLAALMGGCAYAQSDGVSGSVVSVELLQEIAEPVQWEPAFSVRGGELLSRGMNWAPAARPQWEYPDARVLLADDMEVNRELFAEMARPWKLQLRCAADGSEAVRLCAEETFDLIFLDLMMPEMTGKDAAARIRGKQDAPLIALTADISEDTKRLREDFGFADVLLKPMEPADLKACLETYLPKEKRCQPSSFAADLAQLPGSVSRSAYQKTLRTYVREVEPLLEILREDAQRDPEDFRIRVHGIKGVSRQIGRTAAAERAEIMEMAAKAGHQEYIGRHLDGFLSYLREVVEDVRREAALLSLQDGGGKTEGEEARAQSVITDRSVLRRELADAFRSYDMERIERGIRAWEAASPDTAETELLRELREACEEFEYEKGWELLEG